jgi:hypothetical protein
MERKHERIFGEYPNPAKEMFGHSFNLNPKYFDLEQGILQAKVTKVLSRNTYIHIIKYPINSKQKNRSI